MALGIVLAGCAGQASPSTGTTASVSAIASAVPDDQSSAGSSASPSPVPTTAASPSPSVSQGVPATAIPIAQAESILRAGIRKDANVGCKPRQTGLPIGAVAGIECRPATHLVAKVDFYLFAGQADLLSSYFALLSAREVQPRSGDCFGAGAGEDAYTPGDGTGTFIADREGCFIAAGKAADLVTLPGEPIGDGGYTFGGPFVLVVVGGGSSNPGALHSWAWLGNQAQPGAPTIWRSKP
ncbi:MAG TPA: hypothetical protein VGJ17_06850 [Candidatus Limnocylindrales bacterium]